MMDYKELLKHCTGEIYYPANEFANDLAMSDAGGHVGVRELFFTAKDFIHNTTDESSDDPVRPDELIEYLCEHFKSTVDKIEMHFGMLFGALSASPSIDFEELCVCCGAFGFRWTEARRDIA
ncbi:hypothetical protein ASE48_16215 [Mycobacterium sp. Root265]|uniref:hypothetical protein n=1 Tax=Mycobacterium sp. Root265 TaxID=1736504 RepID=UPI00070A5139|nr:hypothetical protein [Mycobacterium sp. Root265]KRD05718.1 hypothetical protein ASE48_16215 [Mycobacterium sp. Root265]